LDYQGRINRDQDYRDYGLLPKELTPAALLQKHSSYPRNHNIANVFYKAGFVESWGRGFKKIAEEFERASLPLPTIEENGGGVMAVQMSETLSVTSRTIERDCQGYKRSFKDFYWLIFLESKTFYTLTIYPNTSKFTKSNYSKACCLHSCSSNILN
jgi:predicted HTH transcriptional regulator